MDDDPCPYQAIVPFDEDPRGVTFLARALGGERGYVALKLHGPRDDAEAVLARYQQWKLTLDRVQHSSISRLVDVGLTAEGRLYLATQYVAGFPLAALGARASVGADARARMAHQLTDAMDAAHAAGLVHLKLAASKIKISTTNGPRATILGLGSSLIVDGATGDPALDRFALADIVRALAIER
jgi:hypothetical protein